MVGTDHVREDERVPGSRSILADGGVDAIATFLRANDLELVSARPQQLRAMPGRQWSVRHLVRGRAADGVACTLSITVEASRHERSLPPPHPAVQRRLQPREPARHVGDLAVWAFPYDPDLPDLAPAVSGSTVRDGLRAVGLLAPVERAVVSCQVVRYRPSRRAVLGYTLVKFGPGGRRVQRLYGKVLRPPRAERLYDVMEALRLPRGHLRWRGLPRLAVPVPLFGGAMVTAPMPGTPLRTRLLANGALPDPARVAAIPARLGRLDPRPGRSSAALQRDERRDPARLAAHAAAVLGHAQPELRDAIAGVVDAVHAGAETDTVRPRVVHGDYYDDQLFVDDDYGLGLIDLDDVALGDPALDGANLCAHLLALACCYPVAGPRLVAYRALVRADLVRQLDVDPLALAWREALSVLLLATGPLRVLSPRWPEETRRLVDVAARLAAGC